jgi:hypothetical protein
MIYIDLQLHFQRIIIVFSGFILPLPKMINMKGTFKIMALLLILLPAWISVSGQNQYNDFKTMSQKIAKLGTDWPALCSVKSIAKTAGGKDIWVISIGSGERDNKPGIAVLGGIEGNYLFGKELALGFAENILKESGTQEVKTLLNSVTFYVFPDVSPDASEQYFSGLKYERTVNARSTDDDRDFVTDEDPFEDLNKDGYITFIRVTDPSGTLIESEDDKRVLVAADLSKGQMGKYKLFSEGIDNDKDAIFNEDGTGGVSFNKNFTFNYEEFGLNAGLHPMSEPETRAIADYLFDHFNIYATFSFGPQDNLGQSAAGGGRMGAPGGSGATGQSSGQGLGAMQFQGAAGGGRGTGTGDRRITSVMRTDETINKIVSDKFQSVTGLRSAPAAKTTPGNFVDWAYYHYGRYSFGTPGWWFPAERGKNAEASFLKYAEDNKIADVFVPWTEIKHPDFPDKKVEVGGIKPFVMINPPARILDSLILKNYKFVKAVAAMHPELEYLDPKIESLGDNIFRVTITVHNKGIFATCAEIGDMNQWTRLMRIVFEPASGQSFLSGQKTQRIRRLEGDQSTEYKWLVSGKGSVKITAGALNVGTISTSLELK